jgi:hypothetical protein
MKKIKEAPTIWPAKTYKLGRTCLNCGEPIEDQARKNRVHCPAWVDKFGVRHDCKRRKNQTKNQAKEDTLLDLCARHRETNRQIEKAIAAHGDVLSTEILNSYNINLADNLRLHYHSGIVVTEFLGYRIITNLKLQTHKIEPYEQLRVHGDDE